MITHRRVFLCLFLVLAAVGLRAPFLRRAIWNVDEGITVTAAERILSGGVLYHDIADQRSPLVPYLKAGILAICGHWNTTAIHAVLAVLIGLCAVGVWWIARALGGERTGVMSAAVFTVLCFMLPSAEDALAAHTEWFSMSFSIGGFGLFTAALRRPNLLRGLGSGALFGLACLAKQPGLLDWIAALVLASILVAVAPVERRRGWWRFAGGLVVGLAGTIGFAVAYLVWCGAGRDLLYYAWSYNNQVYVPAVPFGERFATMLVPFRLAWDHAPIAFGLGLIGAITLPVAAVRGWRRGVVDTRLLPWLALGWTAAGLLATSLSGRAFSHYSIQVIPGLSLACGWVLAALGEWCVARGRVVRTTAMAALTAAVAITGLQLARRIISLERGDSLWAAGMDVVRDLTDARDPVFFWGFTPDCYVHVRRLPATRFVYTTFLTGMIPWTNLDPLIDTSAVVTAGSWDQLREDFARTPPAMIIDTGTIRHQGKYPLRDQPWLWSLITHEYAEVRAGAAVPGGFRYYRRLAQVPSAVCATPALADGAVTLAVENVSRVGAAPRLLVTAPAGASRVTLLADGRPLRSLAVSDARVDVAFFLHAEELPGDRQSIAAMVDYPTGARASATMELCRQDLRIGAGAPGPAIALLGSEIRPLTSEALDGQPSQAVGEPQIWRTHPSAQMVYARPAGLRSFTFSFGLSPECYYDSPEHKASDGADFVVEYIDPSAGRSRLFERRLFPKVRQQDCGPQNAEIVLPGAGVGTIVVRVLAGPANDVDHDWAYVRDMTGAGFGPPLTFGARLLPAERVSAHNEPIMTCDAQRRWTAHSPSSVTYELPPDACVFSFDYGLEPASYDGSQGGRTDGISVTVTAEESDGATCPIFERVLAPAKVAEDRGPQSARIDLTGRKVRRVTVAIGPGSHGNFSYDWSYLSNLRLESDTVALSP